MKKKILYTLGFTIFLIAGLSIAYKTRVKIDPPPVGDMSPLDWEREEITDNFYKIKDSWLKQNEYGYWELYLSGSPFERGVANGKLTEEIEVKQEEAFVKEIRRQVPSPSYLNFLKYFVAWFNRDIDQHIPVEFQQEIYGASFMADPQFDFIGPPYQRKLNYHGAHDIGHALQNMNLVACTSFAVWGSKSADSTLLIGRNFDFYVGDEFGKQKVLVFFNPDSGYKFMSISWPGMMGVVSGMNEKGLTVTLNAAKSSIPTGAATPVAIVAREMLQYAKNIEEAYAIAQKRQTFVAESFLIGSQEDGRTAIIEKSPEQIALFDPEGEQMICANHFQSDLFAKEALNKQHMQESPSPYRQKRVNELLSTAETLTPMTIAEILRDKRGLNNENIGLGNEKAVNQLIAHHAVIFRPATKTVWISTKPHQLGQFIAYQLDDVFAKAQTLDTKQALVSDSLFIEADPFLTSGGFKLYEEFKLLRDRMKAYIAGKSEAISEADLATFEELNPNYYYTYWLLGDYFQAAQNCKKAIEYYETALAKEIANDFEKKAIEGSMADCEL